MMNAPFQRLKFDETVECDVLIIGGGLAGTWAAVRAAQGGDLKVTLVDKAHVGRSGQSPFAAGIFTVFDPRSDDEDLWLEEMVTRGEYTNNQLWVKQLFDETWPLAEAMQEWGQQWNMKIFEEDENGKRLRRRSRAHVKTQHDVINSIPMMDTMRRKVRQHRVTMVENVMITDLVTDNGRVIGALGFASRTRKLYLFVAKTIVLAAAGSGLKSIFMGHQNLTGDLLVAAYEAGVALQNMENSASNTCSALLDIHGLNLYVGVGGKFINTEGEEFMWQYDPELGNRARLQDLVLAFCQEAEAGRAPVHLDMSAASPEDRQLCRKILPETFRAWDKAGIDPFEQPVEWVPSYYGTITSGGGISIDLNGETNIPGLFAAGDLTHEPPHGTYSIGGINIAFAAVSGHIAGIKAAERARQTDMPALSDDRITLAGHTAQQRMRPLMKKGTIDCELAIKEIHAALIPTRFSYLRSRESIEESLQLLEAVEQDMLPNLAAGDAHELMKTVEVKNLVCVGKLMMQSALFREESRGFHFRRDFPYTDNVNWLKWVKIQKDGEKAKVWSEDVPTPFLRPTHDRTSPPGVKASPQARGSGT